MLSRYRAHHETLDLPSQLHNDSESDDDDNYNNGYGNYTHRRYHALWQVRSPSAESSGEISIPDTVHKSVLYLSKMPVRQSFSNALMLKCIY